MGGNGSGRLTKEKQAALDAANEENERQWEPPRTDNKGRCLLEVVHLHQPLSLNIQGSPKAIRFDAPGVEFLGLDYGRRELLIRFKTHGAIRLPVEGNVHWYKARAWKDATPPARDP